MDHQEKASLIRRISHGWDMRYVDFNQDRIFVKFIDPSSELILESDFIYREAEEKARVNGLLTHDEAMDLLRSEGKWNSDMDKKEIQLQQSIKGFKTQINKLKFQKIQRKKVQMALEESENGLRELAKIKNQLESSTIEHFSEVARRRWLMRRSVEIKDPESKDLIFSEKFIEKCIWIYYDKSVPKMSQVREIARSEPWRMYWTLSKETATPTFGSFATNITEAQYTLVLWSRIYDFAFESENRPENEVVDDDTKFDAWYEKEIERIEETNKNNQNSKSGNWKDGQEVFIPADVEGARDVYSMNSQHNRQKIKGRQAAINKEGQITEANLPDIKKDLIMQANRANAQGVIERSKGGL